MSLPELEPPILVQDTAGLDELIHDLDGQSQIAVDTEADSFFSYREKVCLVQITVEDRDYLVDPLADGVDLGRLGDMFADPDRTKVFHDSEYDVLLLKRNHGFEFAGLFDTRVAAATLGSTSPGLASVLEEHFGVVLDKSQQRSDWAQRPLSPKQVAYARLDTHFLLPLMAEQRRELEERDRLVIVESECRRLEALSPPRQVQNPDEFVRIKGSRALDPSERRILRELYILREELAEGWNVPPFRVMNNPLLLQLARVKPRNAKQLGQVSGFTPRLVRKVGDKVLERVASAVEMPPIRNMPVLPKKDGTEGMNEIAMELYDRLKKWRKKVAEELCLESSYLMNRHVMARLANEQPESLKQISRVEGVESWQVERLGEGLARCLARFHEDLKAGRVPSESSWRGRRRRRN